MVNPFDLEQTSLVHSASDLIATDAVKHELVGAKSLVEYRFMSFVKENLLSDYLDLFATIKKAKLKTFSSDLKPGTMFTSKGKETYVLTCCSLSIAGTLI